MDETMTKRAMMASRTTRSVTRSMGKKGGKKNKSLLQSNVHQPYVPPAAKRSQWSWEQQRVHAAHLLAALEEFVLINDDDTADESRRADAVKRLKTLY
jgi:hypothetical protein